jgi:O-antigen ligase
MHAALDARVPIARATRPRVRTRRLPSVVTLLIIAIFLPEAFSFTIFDFRLTAARLIALVMVPVLLVAFSGLLTSRNYRFVASDMLVPITGLWMMLAPAVIDGLPTALKSGGIIALEFIGPYLIVRCFVRSIDHVHLTVRLFCTVAAIVGPLGVLDTIESYPVLRDQLARLTGYVYGSAAIIHDPEDYYRLGLFRAEGVFEHPILFGIAMCYALILVGSLTRARRVLCFFGCGTGLFLSLSSAPWLATVIGLVCLIYRRVARGISRRWLLLVAGGVCVIGAIFIVSKNPFGFIFSHMTLDAATAYFRLLIWQYAGWDLWQSPIFGIGLLTDWLRPEWMPDSVDSLWLRAAMLYGIPGSVLIGISLISASSRSVRITPRNAKYIGQREVRLAEVLGIITFLTIFLGFTVHYWGICSLILSLLVGIRATLGQLAAE